MKRGGLARYEVVCVFLWLFVLAGACQRTAATRAALKAQESEWSTRISALRDRQVEAAARLSRIPSRAGDGDDGGWEAQRRRVESYVEGTKLTLSDVDVRRKESVAEVEAALEKGRADSETTLGEASARMSGFLAMQEQQLVSTEDALARLEEGGRTGGQGR